MIHTLLTNAFHEPAHRSISQRRQASIFAVEFPLSAWDEKTYLLRGYGTERLNKGVTEGSISWEAVRKEMSYIRNGFTG